MNNYEELSKHVNRAMCDVDTVSKILKGEMDCTTDYALFRLACAEKELIKLSVLLRKTES